MVGPESSLADIAGSAVIELHCTNGLASRSPARRSIMSVSRYRIDSGVHMRTHRFNTSSLVTLEKSKHGIRGRGSGEHVKDRRPRV